MNVTATEVFEFLAQGNAGVIERHEIASADFGDLRASLWAISCRILDTDDDQAIDAAGKLRSYLSELLTVPINFDHLLLEKMQGIIGSLEDVENRWGSDVGSLYVQATNAIENLRQNRNPIRSVLAACLEATEISGQSALVYCHRRARPHFASLLPQKLSADDCFLHTVTDYRESGLFDVLIKVGPLRSRGWGSVPDALLTAPRFKKLINLVWSGCSNATDFGYDPAESISEIASEGDVNYAVAEPKETSWPSWTTLVKKHGEDYRKGLRTEILVDELAFLSQQNRSAEMKRHAALVQVDEDHGILFPPNGMVTSFDPTAKTNLAIAPRSVADELKEGMFVILYDDLDFDLGGLQAEPGYYSDLWRANLEKEWNESSQGLINRLKAAGINLLRLDLAIPKWIRSPESVIHAPQRKDHFSILLQVLNLDKDVEVEGRAKKVPFEKLAWNEIRASRGVAIQAGFQEHEIVEEQLLTILNEHIDTICEYAAKDRSFHLRIPPGSGINGHFRFFRVNGIESGFLAPWQEFRIVHNLETIDQWRD